MRPYYLLLVLFISSLASAQSCNDSMDRSSIKGRFVDLNDGYVLDVVTMLEWSFCSYGQTYINGGCTGVPNQYETFFDALNAIKDEEGLRLPNIKELSTLVERSCVEPSIDQEVFPDTPLYVYWSNTPGQDGKGLVIDFTDGSEIIRDINRPKIIRVVKVR